MKRVIHALLFSLLLAGSGTLLLVSPWGRHLEEDLGLAVLFKLRGPRHPPNNVVIVNIDDESASLPRRTYADLIRRLKGFEAAVIVFDVHFAADTAAPDDEMLGEAIRQAGNVILVEKLVRRQLEPSGSPDRRETVDLELLIPPIPLLAQAALAVAPFPLPKVPVRVNQAWTFKTSMGGIPTLPVAALQALALKHCEQFFHCLEQLAPAEFSNLPVSIRQNLAGSGLVETMLQIRGVLQNSSAELLLSRTPAHCAGLAHEEQQALEAMIHLYCGENDMYINYYGPPATLTTYPLFHILSAGEADAVSLKTKLKDAVVFVGAARTSWPEQKDGFFTVFSQPDGLDLSGVELAATVFANLRDHQPLRPLRPLSSFLFLLAAAAMSCLSSVLLSPLPALYALTAFVASSLVVVRFFFSMGGFWPPVMVPLALLPPGSYMAGILYNYFRARRERKHVQKALELYLPESVVEELAQDLSFVKTGDRTVHSVCLLSDAVNYTTLSEKLSPKELSAVMKRYYECIFKQVTGNGGAVINMIGDTMLAMWPSAEPQAVLKERGCRAAIQIYAAIEALNREAPEQALPTRIGLHSGYLLMGNIGAEGHYEYAPVGDIVNTASRIEGLNKLLGTWILASEETVDQQRDLTTRLMGTFLLSGKSRPVTIYQLLTKRDLTQSSRRLHGELFPEVLDLFQKRKWAEAESAVQRCLELQPDDGPSRFYRELCASYRRTPPAEDWEGIIPVRK